MILELFQDLPIVSTVQHEGCWLGTSLSGRVGPLLQTATLLCAGYAGFLEMASHLLDQEKRYSFRQAAQQSIPDYYFFNVSLVSKATEVRMFPEILSDVKIFWTPNGPDLGHIQY